MNGRLGEGSPEPLGLTLDERGANIAVFSAHAKAIELCLFDANGEAETGRHRLPCRTGDVFHGYFAGIRAGQRYGFRAYGPYAPNEGHWFNPAKLLADPYALALDRPFALAPAMFGSRLGASDAALSLDPSDSAPVMPKAIAISPAAGASAPHPRRPWADTIIYELHVRGFTKLNPRVPEAIRGTFAGLAHPAAIDHLVHLGVTAIEIMPCAAWLDERHLKAAGLTNYWGYNPITLMAPDPRLAPGGWDEVRESIAALHAAGIEVIVDVVLNHTGEGDDCGPTVSFRGLDNASYYRLRKDNPRYYINDAGCGNMLALDRPPGVRLAMDALRTWVRLGGVDGFRFDLATVLGRRDDGFDAAAPLITAISQDPILREVRLIAEPWDIGPGGYQVGAFPPQWREWNDQFRDTVRRFWRGDGGLSAPAVTRFAGSSDIFGPHRRPSCSLNFIVAHDGFTLADLVSHERKHNEANGEGNRDGTDSNYSWNNGVEGASSDPAILADRQRDQRNLLASLLLARGTPMLAMGSECGQSQGGNNNAYAQDNAMTWLGWDKADASLTAYTARLIALRKAHPALSRDQFLTGHSADDALIPDVEWLTASGGPMQGYDWGDANLRTVIAALYAPASDGRSADRVLCIFHAGRKPLVVTLPDARRGFSWHPCLDTAQETGRAEASAVTESGTVTVAPRSVMVLEEKPAAKPGIAVTNGKAASPDVLDKLARAAGIAPDWYDISGQRYVVSDETKTALLADMGLLASSTSQARESLGRLAEDLDRRALPFTATARDGEAVRIRIPLSNGHAPRALSVQLEDGSEKTIRLSPADIDYTSFTALDGRRQDAAVAKLPPYPAGRHRVMLEGRPESACSLTVAPKRCYLPDEFASGKKAPGVAAQLYSLRREGDQGIGDFTTLAGLARMAGAAGFATAGLNPLHALFPSDRGRASPYYPSDRRFLDPIYIDVDALGTAMAGKRWAAALNRHGNAVAVLSAQAQVDYAGVWAAKRDILDAAFADFEERWAQTPNAGLFREFEAFVAAGGETLFQFACFEAISEARRGEPWTIWPAGLAAREAGAVAAFVQENARLVRFHLYLQWLCERQFARASAEGRDSGLWLGFYRDLAVGAASEGAEAWANADQLLRRTSTGAPPDPFAECGQNWGLQPPNPIAWRRSAYSFFAGLAAANMRHAGALRIDHAMGLARLFVIPTGAKSRQGAYLSYPADDLTAILALESWRARCLVVGEDLGTVPWGFRETMDAAGILSYRVFWFERSGCDFTPPAYYPRKSLACLTTHDLPTFTGWWQGEDIREKEALGFLSEEEAEAAREGRISDKRALLRLIGREDLGNPAGLAAPADASIVAAAHRLLGGASSFITIAQLDDIVGEVTAVNLPGTDFERPNWRRKLNGDIGGLREKLAAFASLLKA
jgi:glycogen operon protein